MCIHNVSDTNCGLENKREPKTVYLCRENSKIQTNSLFRNVNKFACLQQLSNSNVLSLDSDNSTIIKDGAQLDNNCIKDVVTESSKTRVTKSENVFTDTKKSSNVKRNAKSTSQSKAVDSSQVATNYVTNDDLIKWNAVGTVSPVTVYVSESGPHPNKCTDVATDLKPDKYDLDL